MQEYFGFKAGTLLPAAAGAFVYAVRVGEQTWFGRLTGGVSGFFTAAYVAPAIVQHYSFGAELSGGVTFGIGVVGAALVEFAIGAARDPMGFYERLKKR